jgi:hypothetical protein
MVVRQEKLSARVRTSTCLIEQHSFDHIHRKPTKQGQAYHHFIRFSRLGVFGKPIFIQLPALMDFSN